MSKLIHTTTTPESAETREPAEIKLPTRARLSPSYRGQRFRPHGTDTIGVIRSWSKRTIQFHYLHAPDVPHSIERHEFTERFAEWLPRPDTAKPSRAAQQAARALPPRLAQAHVQVIPVKHDAAYASIASAFRHLADVLKGVA